MTRRYQDSSNLLSRHPSGQVTSAPLPPSAQQAPPAGYSPHLHPPASYLSAAFNHHADYLNNLNAAAAAAALASSSAAANDEASLRMARKRALSPGVSFNMEPFHTM